MAVNLSPVGGAAAQFFNVNGTPLSGGFIYTYDAGTTTPQTTYTTSAGNIAHSNPIQLDSSGKIPGGELWVLSGNAYKFVIKDANLVLMGTYDNVIVGANAAQIVFTGFNGQTGTVEDLAGNEGSDWIGFLQSGTGAVAISAQTKMRQIVSITDFGADPTGVADSTTAINNALAASKNVFIPAGTYLTTGNHTITTQTVTGAGKAVAIIKRSSGTNSVFKLMDDGEIQNLTIDGNNTWGNGLTISTTTYGQYKPSLTNNIAVKNIGTTAAAISITGITNAAQCEITAPAHGFQAGDYVNIRSVIGLYSTASPSKSVVSGLWKVVTASTNTFTIDLDTTSWTAYVSGGQALRASFGICIEKIGSGGVGNNKTINNIELRNNDNHIYFNNGFATTFNDIQMFGNNSRAGIYIKNADTIWFNNTYLESNIETFYYGVRALTFVNTYINIQSSSTFVGELIRSVGMNDGDGMAGGEVADLTFINLKIYRLKSSTASAMIATNSYDSLFDNVSVRDTASSANWFVFALFGIYNTTLKSFIIESGTAWQFIDSVWNYGIEIYAESINYTQGLNGICNWPNINSPFTTTGFISVKGSNCNHKVILGTGNRAYWFENIKGDVDLTNCSAGGCFLYNVSGTVTDPNGAASIQITDGSGIKLNTQFVYANNAAAVAAGLAVGTVYQTSTGVLMIVY